MEVTRTTTMSISDYDRGFRDGQQARKYEDARRDYERGYRDGYGSQWPVMPYVLPVCPMPWYPTYPAMPMWGDSGTYKFESPLLPVTCAFN